MKTRICLLSFLVIAQLLIIYEVRAEWIEVPLDNPGAETGDMTGWIPDRVSNPMNYMAVSNPSIAYKGNFYFSPISLDEQNNNDMKQVIDISTYGISLRNVEFSGYMNITNDLQHRMGYDQETDTEYEYILYNYVALSFYDINNAYLYGMGNGAYENEFLNWKYGSVNTNDPWRIDGWKSIRDDVHYVEVNFHFYYHAVDSDNAPIWYNIEEWRNWIGAEPIVRIDSAQLRIEIVDGLPVIQETVFILTDTSPDATISANTIAQVYGTAEANRITVESGAKAELLNFPGSNTITIQSDSSLFAVSRSGAYATFEETDGTILKIPATLESQTIVFNDGSWSLIIDSGQVMLGDQEISFTPSAID